MSEDLIAVVGFSSFLMTAVCVVGWMISVIWDADLAAKWFVSVAVVSFALMCLMAALDRP